MSKADTLGAAPAFGAARGARSSRRAAIERVTGGESSELASLTELPLPLISENPDNPRNHLRNLDDTVETVRELGVILPIVVATVDAYLRDRPERAGDLEEGAQYIVIDGHRRLEAARRVGLATIPVRVDNARVSSDEALLEAAFVANYHRDDMTDLEEAQALQTLVDHYGSQTKAAKRLGIPQGTISSKLSLLKLSPELQRDLVEGVRKVEHVRNLGKLSPEEQKAKADERAAAARREPGAEATAGERNADYHAVIVHDRETTQAATQALTQRLTQTPAQASAPTAAVAPTAPAVPAAAPVGEAETAAAAVDQLSGGGEVGVEPAAAPAENADVVPEPRAAQAVAESEPAQQPKRLPYDQPLYIGMHLERKMSPGDLKAMVTYLLKRFRQNDPELLAEVLRAADAGE
ncbi:ParB/RepB/Spo0J family partition protein [Streptomyces sp. UH6]|uniref:ParB/RepB/Spo0J family partition protein n=1 Tax=Streptomyces sp. UH6 TaxID=2748379 RepID=UPI0015D4A4B9|nr:ParB/RepB/Spo0J family partition protein [Streptomyces sp. UH6]NYV73387.1 ParB/RepB/Spo0J family partition protein [Streptomyces sp. UH6]